MSWFILYLVLFLTVNIVYIYLQTAAQHNNGINMASLGWSASRGYFGSEQWRVLSVGSASNYVIIRIYLEWPPQFRRLSSPPGCTLLPGYAVLRISVLLFRVHCLKETRAPSVGCGGLLVLLLRFFCSCIFRSRSEIVWLVIGS